MFKTKLTALIDEAVQDCLTYGRGHERQANIDVIVEWAENEADIEITIMQDLTIRFEYTETVPEKYR